VEVKNDNKLLLLSELYYQKTFSHSNGRSNILVLICLKKCFRKISIKVRIFIINLYFVAIYIIYKKKCKDYNSVFKTCNKIMV
jgi:hypothetical protein